MPKKLSPEQEMIAAKMAATSAAFQVLVNCLQENETLHHGQFPEALRAYMEMTKRHDGNDLELTMLHDLRIALIN